MEKRYEIITGDCKSILPTLPGGSVQTVITSPPYFGLRDYGTATWVGGDPNCEHGTVFENGKSCALCDAVIEDLQVGLEKTPDAYVANLVDVMRETWRVLRDDGTLWLNLGDSYFSNTKGTGGNSGKQVSNAGSRYKKRNFERNGMKQKDLIGIPWRVALALQADGWYLRSDIIWSKRNPMPESVADRPTKSHEYIFLLTKSPIYYYDAEAIKEPAAYDGRKDEMHKGGVKNYDGVMPDGNPQSFAQNAHPRWKKDGNGNRVRNKRTVWETSTKSFKGAHFATFPPALIEPCVLAGSRAGDVVLDPFSGAGTTGLVALRHGRQYLGIELNPKYVELTESRYQSEGVAWL